AVRVEEIHAGPRVDGADAVTDAGLGHLRPVRDLDGRGRLLPLRDRVLGQASRQHQQAFVLAARADALAQLADRAPAAGSAAVLERHQAARRTRPAPAQRLDVDGAVD